MPYRLALSVAALSWLAAPAFAQDAPSPAEIMEAWMASPHADAEAEAFTHWDEEGEVPNACAVCHSQSGFIDYVGGDGSAAGSIETPVTAGAPIGCESCHNDASMALEVVTFPSGATAEGLGTSTMCAVCHQGRESTDSVDAALDGTEADTVSPDLGFVNIHYRAAAATLFGGEARGGYQYDGADYAGRFTHIPQLDTCTDCHSPHALEVAEATCLACHENAESLEAIRVTEADIDGDGDAAEGIASEISTLHERLLAAIQTYAADVAGQPIAYAPGSYPYFFADTNGDGTAGEDEAAFPNRYQSWTPRLLRAAYNYQFVAKDPGGYAHNPHYVSQLLIDSLSSLGEQVEVDTASFARP